jgi:hypothetical protein
MKTLAELQTEIELGITVYRTDGACSIHGDSYGFWFCGPGLDNLYPSFNALYEVVDDADKHVWSTS